MFYFMVVMTFICVLNIFIMFFIVWKIYKEVLDMTGDK